MLRRLEDVSSEYPEAVDVLLPRGVALAVVRHEDPEFGLRVGPEEIGEYSSVVCDLAYGEVLKGNCHVA